MCGVSPISSNRSVVKTNRDDPGFSGSCFSVLIVGVMFLRRITRRKKGKTHLYWSVVENKRLDDGRVVQRHVHADDAPAERALDQRRVHLVGQIARANSAKAREKVLPMALASVVPNRECDAATLSLGRTPVIPAQAPGKSVCRPTARTTAYRLRPFASGTGLARLSQLAE